MPWARQLAKLSHEMRKIPNKANFLIFGLDAASPCELWRTVPRQLIDLRYLQIPNEANSLLFVCLVPLEKLCQEPVLC